MTREANKLSTNRIVKNTLMLYIRMFFAMIVGLYTSRVVIHVLGLSNYGLYSVVGGVVTILIFVNNTLTSGTQRFLNYALGEGDELKLKKTFSTALLMHLIIALFFVLICETAGLWFLNNKINIPEGRENAAFWVFQLSVLSIFVLTVFVPYTSSIVAHEKFKIYAYMSIFDVGLNLVIVFLLKIAGGDKLILYSFLVVIVNIITTLIYCMYCHKHFKECRFKITYERSIFKEMFKFSGWNLFGCASVTLQNQGINILINIYFGTIANAARAIAMQINQKILQFVNGFQTAINPQIVKLYATGNMTDLTRLIINNSKLAAYLFLFIAIPVSVEIDYILKIWLGNVPSITSILVYIILFQTLVQIISRPVVMLVHAVGKMKMVNLTAGGVLLLILPISLLLAHVGFNIETIFIINIIPWFLETFLELYFEQKYCNFPLEKFYKEVYLSVFPLTILMLIPPLIIKYLLHGNNFSQFIIVELVALLSTIFIILFLGMSKAQRNKVYNKVKSIILRIR